MHSSEGHRLSCRLLSSAGPIAALMIASGFAACAQSSASPQQTPGAPVGASNSHVTGAKPAATAEVHAITEDQLKAQLQGKTFYLRSGYIDNELHFNDQGNLLGSSPKGSYTLSMVQIDRVHLSKHKVELVGIRYGIHFLGASPTEDPLTASDKVRITPKKKVLRIAIDRAQVVAPKKAKKSKHAAARVAPANSLATQSPAESSAGPQAAQQIDSGEVSSLTQARANQLLKEALDRVLSAGLDDRMIASLPDFWRLYYQDAAAKTDYKPSEASVLRQNAVDQKARLLTNFQPASNDFAQAAGVAGMAMYHVVVGSDGKPAEIAVGRPIGFGLDENAVAAIRKASFQPAMKDGKPVPVVLDLVVQFRIYSNRTGATGITEAASARVNEPDGPTLPGPYSASQPAAKQQ